jgi:hypothetical protein
VQIYTHFRIHKSKNNIDYNCWSIAVA